jgi:hypothetical protein
VGDTPQNIQPAWYSLISRLQSVSKSGGIAILHITVMVDPDGTPILWTEPQRVLIEPKSRANAIMQMLKET